MRLSLEEIKRLKLLFHTKLVANRRLYSALYISRLGEISLKIDTIFTYKELLKLTVAMGFLKREIERIGKER